MSKSTSAFLENASSEEIITWSMKTFAQNLVMTSSFGVHSAGLLHLVVQQLPNIPVIFIRHPYLPPEIDTFVKDLRQTLHLNVKTYVPKQCHSLEEMQELFLTKTDDEKTLRKRKALAEQYKEYPLRYALQNLHARAWISGVMEHETPERKELDPVMYDLQYQLTKIHPILKWTQKNLQNYISKHNLPTNQSYFDMFKGPDQKAECGIHTFVINANNSSSN